MAFLRVVIGIIGGLTAGALLGFGAALIAMSVDGSPRSGGTFGMLEVFTMVPLGAILSFIGGGVWGARSFKRRPKAGPVSDPPST